MEEKIKIKECIRCCVWGKGYPHQRPQTPPIPIELVRPPLQMPQTRTGLVIHCACKDHSDVSTTHVYAHVCPDNKVHAHELLYSPPCDMVPASSLNTLMCCSTSFTRTHGSPFSPSLNCPLTSRPLHELFMQPVKLFYLLIPTQKELSLSSLARVPNPGIYASSLSLLFSPSHNPCHTVMEEPI